GFDPFPETSEIVCGATLVSRDIAISAAHCQGAFNYGIRVLDEATNDYTRQLDVSHQIRHPGWDEDRENLNHDILVLKLATPLSRNDVAQPIPYNTDRNYPSPGQSVLALGFGLTETQSVAPDLMEAEMEYISNDECWGRTIQFNNVIQAEEVMCTDPIAGSSTCLGDSGGPLTDRDGTRLLGIVSFGSGCNPDQIPDGYSATADWVFEQICALSDDPPSNCPPMGRDSSEVKMALYFDHDFFSEETTFSIREQRSRNIVYTGPTYTPERGERAKSEFYLLPGDYTFEVYDTDGNGLMSEGNGEDGSWYLEALYSDSNEDRVASGGPFFGREDYVNFRVDPAQATPGPTPAPTNPPPTNPPTNNPATDACLVSKAKEDIAGALFGTTCECFSDAGQLICRNGNNQVCQTLNRECVINQDCCSGRGCRAGFCRDNNTGGGGSREDSRLGGAAIGGAAGRQGGRDGGRLLRGRQL
ncbi:MAG: hypothetical protein SGILL_001287, partial [Bacillariaceae sp.]